MIGKMKEEIKAILAEIQSEGLYKYERVLDSPQGVRIRVRGREVLNLCSNNYLGLASAPEVVEAAKEALDRWGYGLSSVRFICGTQGIHAELERELSRFLGTDDTILYSSCFDANGGVFEPILGERDAIISDELNHASIIDGIRLCKAERFRYAHSSMEDLERALKETKAKRFRMICTDGVFSMDGDIARLKEIAELAERYEALLMVDDSHATGYIGKTGRGTAEFWDIEGKVDIVTTTFGKALGGASGGCIAGRAEIIELLRQRSRPYLFSNTIAPTVAGATLAVLRLLSQGENERAQTLKKNAAYFRKGITEAGFTVLPGETAIVPVMLNEETLAHTMAEKLLDEGIYVIGFSYPVVPRGRARIRTQVSACHTAADLDQAVSAFIKVGRELKVI